MQCCLLITAHLGGIEADAVLIADIPLWNIANLLQPLPVHCPDAAQGHDLAADWSLPSEHFFANAHFGARLGAFFY